MTTPATPRSWSPVLHAIATHLHTDPAAADMVEELKALATALHHPSGYVVKVFGAAIRYDLCAATQADAALAARRANMEPGQFTVEPFLILHP